jgi:hypothetical protein
MFLSKFYNKIIILSLLLISSVYSSAPTSSVNYEYIGRWYDGAKPITIQLIPTQEEVFMAPKGINALKVSVLTGKEITQYFSGFMTQKADKITLIDVFARHSVTEFSIEDMKIVKNCSYNNGNINIPIMKKLFVSVRGYIDFCIQTLKIEDKGKNIPKVITLHEMLNESEITNLTGSSLKLKLSGMLSQLRNFMTELAHSEMIALYETMLLAKVDTPFIMVSKNDMCYQCEKACAYSLPVIKVPATVKINPHDETYKILVGSYLPYSNDGVEPRNTRKRDGKAEGLLKIALLSPPTSISISSSVSLAPSPSSSVPQ